MKALKSGYPSMECLSLPPSAPAPPFCCGWTGYKAATASAAAVARAVGGTIPDLLLLHDGVTSPLWEVFHLCLGREELEELSDVTWCSWGHGTERGDNVFTFLE